MIIDCLFYRMLVQDLNAFNNEAYPVVQNIVNDGDTLLTKFKDNLTSCSVTFVDTLKKNSTKYLTSGIYELDNNRDSADIGFIGYVKSFLHSPDKSKVESAKRILNCIGSFGRYFYNESLSKQTVITDQLVATLEADFMDDINNINAAEWLTAVKSSNQLFDAKFSERKDAVDNFPKSNASETGQSLIDAYRKVFSYIDIMTDMTGHPSFVEADNSLNNIIANFNASIRSRITKSSNNENQEVSTEVLD